MHASTGEQGRRGRAGRDPTGGGGDGSPSATLSQGSHTCTTACRSCMCVALCNFVFLCVVGCWLCVSLVFVNCFFCDMKNPCVCFAGVQRFVFAVYIGFMSDLGGC